MDTESKLSLAANPKTEVSHSTSSKLASKANVLFLRGSVPSVIYGFAACFIRDYVFNQVFRTCYTALAIVAITGGTLVTFAAITKPRSAITADRSLLLALIVHALMVSLSLFNMLSSFGFIGYVMLGRNSEPSELAVFITRWRLARSILSEQSMHSLSLSETAVICFKKGMTRSNTSGRRSYAASCASRRGWGR